MLNRALLMLLLACWYCTRHLIQVVNAGTLKWNFQCPIVRELMLSLGLIDVSKRTLLKVKQILQSLCHHQPYHTLLQQASSHIRKVYWIVVRNKSRQMRYLSHSMLACAKSGSIQHKWCLQPTVENHAGPAKAWKGSGISSGWCRGVFAIVSPYYGPCIEEEAGICKDSGTSRLTQPH